MSGAAVGPWGLLLAFHVGQAGDAALAQLVPGAMISAGPAEQHDAMRLCWVPSAALVSISVCRSSSSKRS